MCLDMPWCVKFGIMQVLDDPLLEPHVCLEYFAKALEVDEMGCGWKKQFETKMEKIGDFFTLPPKDDRVRHGIACSSPPV